MVVSLETKHLIAIAMLLLGLLIGWFVWGANPSGRYQRVSGSGYVFDTRTGNYVDPSSGKSLVEIETEYRESAARREIWNIVKGTPPEQISNERVRRELGVRGHEVPNDFDVHFDRARRWVVVNRWRVRETP